MPQWASSRAALERPAEADIEPHLFQLYGDTCAFSNGVGSSVSDVRHRASSCELDHREHVSRCLQFHFAPLPQAAVEKILKEKTDRKPAEIKLAAQLAEGSPGLAIEMDVNAAADRRRNALGILERAAQGQGFAQIFSATSALAKDRDSSFEDQIGVFYGLLTDLLELTSKLKEPVLRNVPLAKELSSLSKSVDSAWVLRAIAGFDELYAGLRRNLNRQLGLDSLAASLVPLTSRTPAPRP